MKKFLWDSKKDRNSKTLENIASEEQKQPGIVTRDGIIIDGNRRAMLLNRIKNNPHIYNASSHEHANFFNAIILDSDGTPKDVQRLETKYQMGQDEKLDYNPIEKYLKVKTLKKNDFSFEEIASLMNEQKSKVIEWSETMDYMEKYLDNYGYSNIYTMLEKKRRPIFDIKKKQ